MVILGTEAPRTKGIPSNILFADARLCDEAFREKSYEEESEEDFICLHDQIKYIMIAHWISR